MPFGQSPMFTEGRALLSQGKSMKGCTLCPPEPELLRVSQRPSAAHALLTHTFPTLPLCNCPKCIPGAWQRSGEVLGHNDQTCI